MKRISFGVLSLLLLACLGASAAQLNFASPVTVNAWDVGSGPSITVLSAMSASDVLNISVSGTACLQPDGQYCTNAAGVIVTPGQNGEATGAAIATPTFPFFTYGSLLFGNSTLGFVQLFASDASNGLGSLTPPTTLLLNATLGSLGFTSGIGAGEILEFRVVDELNAVEDNTKGAFVITNTPEPGSMLLVAAGVLALAGLRRRKA